MRVWVWSCGSTSAISSPIRFNSRASWGEGPVRGMLADVRIWHACRRVFFRPGAGDHRGGVGAEILPSDLRRRAVIAQAAVQQCEFRGIVPPVMVGLVIALLHRRGEQAQHQRRKRDQQVDRDLHQFRGFARPVPLRQPGSDENSQGCTRSQQHEDDQSRSDFNWHQSRGPPMAFGVFGSRIELSQQRFTAAGLRCQRNRGGAARLARQ